MAIDNTPPRLKLIATIAIITVVTLVSLDFVFKSYYGMMTDEAGREKIAPTKDKDEARKAEQAALTSANIDQAMKTIAGGARPESINPTPSEDMGPMTGWSKLPKPAPTPQPRATPPPTEIGDGGALLGDGGTLSTEAGAPGAGDAGRGAPPRDRDRHGDHGGR